MTETRHDRGKRPAKRPGGDRPRSRPSRRHDGMRAARQAARQVHDLTGLDPENVVSVTPSGDGWEIGVEVTELHRIPDTTDIMAVYQVELDPDGELVSCRRGQRYHRGSTEAQLGGPQMTQTWSPAPYGSPAAPGRREPANLADILERVLDKGIVIAGDIRVNLLDVELLTIRLRLLIASVDRAKEMGIDWWEHDPTLSSGARDLADENRRLRERIDELQPGGEQPEQPGGEQPEQLGGELPASAGNGHRAGHERAAARAGVRREG